MVYRLLENKENDKKNIAEEKSYNSYVFEHIKRSWSLKQNFKIKFKDFIKKY